MIPKRALVVGSGGLYGAYDAGVLVELCKALGPGYFDAVYACSVGAVTAPFFITEQLETIEQTWCTVAFGKLIQYHNQLKRKKILNLDHLIGLFSEGRSLLDLEKLFASRMKLVFVLTEYKTGKAVYTTPSRENFFEYMRASAAIPILHGPVEIDGIKYVDGGLSDQLPALKALQDGYEEIVVISNRPSAYYAQSLTGLSKLASYLLPTPIARAIRTYDLRLTAIEKAVEQDPEHFILIRPKQALPLNSFVDRDAKRVTATFQMGIRDMHRAIEEKILLSSL